MKTAFLKTIKLRHQVALTIAAAMLLVGGQASAKCNRSSLDDLKRHYTTVTTIYEANWADYIKWMACAAIATGGSAVTGGIAGPAVIAACSSDILNAITSHLAGSVDRSTVLEKIRNGQEFFNGADKCRATILTYQCETCNCKVCVPCFLCSPRANCNDCGEWCTPEPNRFSLVLACHR